jgi:hypothetical protein
MYVRILTPGKIPVRYENRLEAANRQSTLLMKMLVSLSGRLYESGLCYKSVLPALSVLLRSGEVNIAVRVSADLPDVWLI